MSKRLRAEDDAAEAGDERQDGKFTLEKYHSFTMSLSGSQITLSLLFSSLCEMS